MYTLNMYILIFGFVSKAKKFIISFFSYSMGGNKPISVVQPVYRHI